MELIESLNRKLSNALEMQKIVDLTELIGGLKKDTLVKKTRRYDVKTARMVMCNVAMNTLDITKDDVAEFIKKHRTSMYHYQKIHDSQYMVWKEYRELYDKVHEEYTNGKRYATITKDNLYFMLRKNKLYRPNSEDNFQCITLSIGRVKAKVYCDPLEVGELVKTIHKVFDKYIFELKIKSL